ncbi:MAG: DmsE family decaheme c-type cytochrome [Bryobacteraceae bacterium]
MNQGTGLRFFVMAEKKVRQWGTHWRTVARVVLLAIGVLAAFDVIKSVAIAQTAKDAGGFVGTATCKGCHPTISATFFRNPHYKSVAAGNLPPDHTGCEGCHGPGQEHAESKGKTPIARVFPKMQANQVLDACLNCHAKDLSKANIQHSQHTEAGVVCTNCHSVHNSPVKKFLLASKQPDLCYTCHGDVRAQFSMPFKHRVNEGTVLCTDCHNAHGTYAATWRMGARPRMVDQRLGNEEPCLKCHVDKRGPFVFEHASVRVDGCETCHIPHGSANAKLLKRPVAFMVCLECHNGAGNFGRSNDSVILQGSNHNLLDPRYQRCTSCHVRIHGSNSSDHFFR